jgi:hypothetical protein
MKGEYNDSNEWIYAAYLKIQRSESGRSARHVRCEPGGGGGGGYTHAGYTHAPHTSSEPKIQEEIFLEVGA